MPGTGHLVLNSTSSCRHRAITLAEAPQCTSCVGSARIRILAVLSVLWLLAAAGVNAQMDQPLMGQGDQPQDRTTIHMSVFLERLLDIDDKNFRFTCVLFFYLNWKDTRAYGMIANRTEEVRNGGEACERVCTGPAHGRSHWQPWCADNARCIVYRDRVRTCLGLNGERLLEQSKRMRMCTMK
eukprot:scaffold108551_cov33-Prasinocladus_malaysianus.AAC.1